MSRARSCRTRTRGPSLRSTRATIREAVRGLVEEGYLVPPRGLRARLVTARPLLRNSLDTELLVCRVPRVDRRPGRPASHPGAPHGPRRRGRREHLLMDVGLLVVELTRVRTADDRPGSIRWTACRPIWSTASATGLRSAARSMRCSRRAAIRSAMARRRLGRRLPIGNSPPCLPFRKALCSGAFRAGRRRRGRPADAGWWRVPAASSCASTGVTRHVRLTLEELALVPGDRARLVVSEQDDAGRLPMVGHPRWVGVGNADAGLCGGISWFVRECFETGLAPMPAVTSPRRTTARRFSGRSCAVKSCPSTGCAGPCVSGCRPARQPERAASPRRSTRSGRGSGPCVSTPAGCRWSAWCGTTAGTRST